MKGGVPLEKSKISGKIFVGALFVARGTSIGWQIKMACRAKKVKIIGKILPLLSYK